MSSSSDHAARDAALPLEARTALVQALASTARRRRSGLRLTLAAGADDQAVVGVFVWDGPARPWQVIGTLEVIDNLLEIGQLTIRPRDRSKHRVPLSSALLRQIPFAAILKDATTELLADRNVRLAYRLTSGNDLHEPTTRIAEQASAAAEGPRRGGGRPRLSDDFLRDLAQAYTSEFTKHGQRGLHARLAARYFSSPHTVKYWISQARKRGFLTPTKRGRAGGIAHA